MGIGHAQQPTPAKQYTYFDGLPSDRIEAIGQDSLGLIYLKTDKRYSVFNGKQFDDLNEDQISTIRWDDQLDSLPNHIQVKVDGLALTTSYIDKQNSWWLGTSDQGLWYFPGGNSPPRELFIQYIGLNNDRREFPEADLVIPYHYETLTIGYVYPDYTTMGRLQYRYQIEGVHEDWVVTRDQKVQFTALPHGETYRFSVAVQLADGNWSSPKVLTMKFEQAFYRSAWFLTLIGLLILICIWALTRSYFKRKAHVAQLNTQLQQLEGQALQSQMNPHFVFNSLNSIQSFVSSGDELKAEVYLAKFSDLLRKTLESSSSERISLAEEINMLNRYLELESMRFGDRLKYNITTEQGLETDLIKVPAMLIQPFVENAIVHGIGPRPEGGEVKVHFEMKDDSLLRCSVIDNGVGRAAKNNGIHQSMGTDIVKRRLELLGNSHGTPIRYNDLKDPTGTEVFIEIPV